MTPTKQDKELRQKMQDIFNDCTSGWLITIKNFNGYERELGDMESEIIGDILDLITADRKRVALEARIDEIRMIETAQQNTDQWGGFCIDDTSDFLNYIDGRIAELKAQQEEV